MAITPRTILTNPSTATVTALSLFAVTALGLYAFSSTTCERSRVYTKPVHVTKASTSCTTMPQRAGWDTNRRQWSEFQWIKYTECFGQEGKTRRAANTAYSGLRYHPRSEALYDLRGYYQIEMKQYTKAIATLETGLRRIGTPRYGTIENNLAWAGLWAPREMTLTRSRQLYRRSMSRTNPSCEVIHTGLWVEFAISESSQGLERAQALRNFNNLRNSYAKCTSRINNGDKKEMLEVFGAAVMFDRVDRDMKKAHRGLTDCKTKRSPSALFVKRAARKVRDARIGNSSTVCLQAMPVASTHHFCTTALGRTR